MYNIKNIASKLPIETERLIIRTLDTYDLDWYTKLVIRPFMSEYLDNPLVYSENFMEHLVTKLQSLIDDANSLKESPKELRLVIVEKTSMLNIGGITLIPKIEKHGTRINKKSIIEIAYWIIPEYQHLGYAKEALKSISFKLLKIREVRRLILEIQSINIGSIRLAEKCGYTQYEIKDGAVVTNFLYKLDKGDF